MTEWLSKDSKLIFLPKCFHLLYAKKLSTKIPIFLSFKVLFWGLVVFTDMNRFIVKEGRNFKTLLKENYAGALDSCYLFTKIMLKMDFDMILIVLKEFSHTRHCRTSQQIWWIHSNLIRFLIWHSVSLKFYKVFWFLIVWCANFLQTLIVAEYWEPSEALYLNGIGYCKSIFASFRKGFVIYFGIFVTRSTRSFL